jgi:hypothetical protein
LAEGVYCRSRLPETTRKEGKEERTRRDGDARKVSKRGERVAPPSR